ncbi:MAG: transporter [Deltaproteobacteria bacterium]|nr:transporter [Deltaproteobacteria bacterium]
MRSRLVFLSLVFCGILLAGGPSLAGESVFPNLEKPPPSTIGPLITDTAVPIGQGNFSIQPFCFLNITGGRFSPNWRRVSSQGDFYSLQVPVYFTYGPSPNVDLVLVVPYLHNWARDARLPSSREAGSADFGGLGDTTLYVKYQFQEETASRPTCTALAGFGFPTGHHRNLNPSKLRTDLLGTGAYTFTAGLNLSKWYSPVYLYANLWYTLPIIATVDGVPIHDRDLVTLNLAAEWVLTQQWALLLEFYHNWQAGNLLGPKSQQPAQALLGLSVGLEYNMNNHWSFAGGLAVDLAGKNTVYNYSPILTCKYNF